MSGIAAAPEIALISESVENANARIRFFRIAFGAASQGSSVPTREVHDILGDMSRGGRLSYRWDVRGPLERDRVKLAFLLLQCLESALPFGGEIVVKGGEAAWTISGRAERRKVDPELWALLIDPGIDATLSPADVHFALVADAARSANRTVTTDLGDDEIRIVC